MNREIGSEFWSVEKDNYTPVWEKYPGDRRFFLSGRTALYAVIEDIKAEKACQKAYLPSYCCESMAEPFRKHGIEIVYYDIYINDGLKAVINPSEECDIILTVDYFGYCSSPSELPHAVHIHDVTHSLLSTPTYDNADYYFGSLRKWGAVAGAGFACRTKGKFVTGMPSEKNERFLTLRNRAYELKEKYIEYGEGEKQVFLSLFSQAEELLDDDYEGYCADEPSLLSAGAVSNFAQKRRQNAEILISQLKKSSLVDLIFPHLDKDDVPLFVPVTVNNGLRDDLRSHLIKNCVYCPVHWPEHNGRSKEIYKNELSLICDQRYGTDDMQRQIALIKEFEERCYSNNEHTR